jgi:hypothetical protein
MPFADEVLVADADEDEDDSEFDDPVSAREPEYWAVAKVAKASAASSGRTSWRTKSMIA